MIWDNVVLKADDQLRQRMAWALSQTFVVSPDSGNYNSEGAYAYYDIFVRHAFGNMYDVLREVASHPMMGWYLTFAENKALQKKVSEAPKSSACAVM